MAERFSRLHLLKRRRLWFAVRHYHCTGHYHRTEAAEVTCHILTGGGVRLDLFVDDSQAGLTSDGTVRNPLANLELCLGRRAWLDATSRHTNISERSVEKA